MSVPEDLLNSDVRGTFTTITLNGLNGPTLTEDMLAAKILSECDDNSELLEQTIKKINPEKVREKVRKKTEELILFL